MCARAWPFVQLHTLSPFHPAPVPHVPLALPLCGAALFDSLINIELSFAALLKVTFFLNLPTGEQGHARTGHEERARQSRRSQVQRESLERLSAAGNEGRDSSAGARPDGRPHLDGMHIQMLNAGLHAGSGDDPSERITRIIYGGGARSSRGMTSNGSSSNAGSASRPGPKLAKQPSVSAFGSVADLPTGKLKSKRSKAGSVMFADHASISGSGAAGAEAADAYDAASPSPSSAGAPASVQGAADEPPRDPPSSSSPCGSIGGGGGSGWRMARARSSSIFHEAARASRMGVQRGSQAATLRSVNLRLAQGKMYAVVGVRTSSKESLLRLFGKVMAPTGGDVLVPAHLKVQHVERDAQLMRHKTLYENLVLGKRFDEVDLERVCHVCTRLGLSARCIAQIRAGRSLASRTHPTAAGSASGSAPGFAPGSVARVVGPAPATPPARIPSASFAVSAELNSEDIDENERRELSWLSERDCRLVHLARAVLAAPHLLVLHWPLSTLDEADVDRALSVLRQMVDTRGGSIDGGQETAARHQCTVLYTCSMLDTPAMEAADGVIVVGEPEGGATLVRAEQTPTPAAQEEAAAAEVDGGARKQRSRGDQVGGEARSEGAVEVSRSTRGTTRATCGSPAASARSTRSTRSTRGSRSTVSSLSRFTMRERVEALLQREGLSLSDDDESSRSTEVAAPMAQSQGSDSRETRETVSPATLSASSSGPTSAPGGNHGTSRRKSAVAVDDSVVGLRVSASMVDDADADGPPSFRLDWAAAADDGEDDSFTSFKRVGVDSFRSAEQGGDQPGGGRRRLSIQRNVSGRRRRGSIDYASLL